MNTELEAQARALADERGDSFNPWRFHGRRLLEIHAAIVTHLTWRQFKSWNRFSGQWRDMFEGAIKVSKSHRIAALAAEGLEIVKHCEEQK